MSELGWQHLEDRDLCISGESLSYGGCDRSLHAARVAFCSATVLWGHEAPTSFTLDCPAHPRVPSAHHVVVLLWCGHVMGCSRRTIGIRWVLQIRLEVEVGSLNKCTLVCRRSWNLLVVLRWRLVFMLRVDGLLRIKSTVRNLFQMWLRLL